MNIYCIIRIWMNNNYTIFWFLKLQSVNLTNEKLQKAAFFISYEHFTDKMIHLENKGQVSDS